MKATVLLVEDSRFLRRTNEKTLVKAGYTVITAADGEEALRIAHDQRPNLVLLDMMLPKRAGLDVLRSLKRNPLTARIPVIVLSGLSKRNEAKLTEEGAAAYLEKPQSLSERDSAAMLEIIDAILNEQMSVSQQAGR